MTQFDTDETDEEVEDEANSPAGLRKRLKAAERSAREANERAEANSAAARRVAFLDAEIPDNPQTRFFRENYTGSLTPEDIKAKASEYGFITDDDHTKDLDEISGQSGAALGADGPTVLGSQEEMEAEMDKAARNAPRGQESKAIAEVLAKYTRSV